MPVSEYSARGPGLCWLANRLQQGKLQEGAGVHGDHQVFIEAIDERQKVTLTFVSKEDGGASQVRLCAPMDYGPRARARDTRLLPLP
jgi:hypothetical protein